jgi:hypothetical protein
MMALAISLLQTQGDVVFRVLAPKLFPVLALHGFGLCNNPIRWFSEWQYIPFPSD